MSASSRLDGIQHSTIVANSVHFHIARSQETNRGIRGTLSLFHQERHRLLKMLLQHQELSPVTTAIRV
jgi:hypothetical protein